MKYDEVINAFWSDEHITSYKSEIVAMLNEFCSVEYNDEQRSTMFGRIVNAVFNMGRDSIERKAWEKKMKSIFVDRGKNWPDEEE